MSLRLASMRSARTVSGDGSFPRPIWHGDAVNATAPAAPKEASDAQRDSVLVLRAARNVVAHVQATIRPHRSGEGGVMPSKQHIATAKRHRLFRTRCGIRHSMATRLFVSKTVAQARDVVREYKRTPCERCFSDAKVE